MKKMLVVLLSLGLLMSFGYAQEEAAAEQPAVVEEEAPAVVEEEAPAVVEEEAVVAEELMEEELEAAPAGKTLFVGLNLGLPLMVLSSNDDNLGYEAGMGFGLDVSVDGFIPEIAGISFVPGISIGMASLAKGADAESESTVEIAAYLEAEYEVTEGLYVAAMAGAGKFEAIGAMGGVNLYYDLTNLVNQPVYVGLGYTAKFYTDENEVKTSIDGLGIQIGYGIGF